MTLDDNIFKDVFFGPNSSFQSPLTPLTAKMLVSFDGLQSGVPTRTTSTLTPTTLRSIEQTFLDITNDQSSSVPCQAGFVPPLPLFSTFEQESQDHSLGSSGSNSSDSWQSPTPDNDTSTEAAEVQPSKRKMGGRRAKKISNLTPEEEEKRRVRRERNKLAAARCRKRRVDQTNELTDKVEILEKERSKLQQEIQDLQLMKDDLEFCLENHRAQCRLQLNGGLNAIIDRNAKVSQQFKQPTSSAISYDKIKVESVKVEPIDDEGDDIGAPPAKRIFLSSANPVISATTNSLNAQTTAAKPSRPSSLNVPLTMTPSQALGLNRNITDMAGVQISTPSNGVMFNFDSLMDGGTGLTPVAQPILPNCSTQMKSPLDLATPTSEPSKLCSL